MTFITFKKWVENFENFPEGPRREYAIHASMISKYDKNIILNDNEGNIIGIASVWKDPDTTNDDQIPDGRYIRIRNMAVKQKGLGEKLFNEIKKYAKAKNAGIYLNSTYGSENFYIKLGMHKGTGLNYYLTFDEL